MMSASTSDTAVKDVEVRTWPQRADVLVIDPYEAAVLAHFPFSDPAEGKVSDLTCGYDERSRRALAQLEADQSYLKAHYVVDGGQSVRLRPVSDVRNIIAELLSAYDLTLEQTEFPQLRQTLQALENLETRALYQLMCDWYDVVERHFAAGRAARDPQSWVHRATPEDCYHFHYLAAGLSSLDEATPDDSGDAHIMLRQLVNVDLEQFTFGHAIRWVYFHRAEFAGMERFELDALTQAGV